MTNCEHEFEEQGQCRPRICKLCGENEPQIQHDLKVIYKGKEFRFDKDFTFDGTTLTFKESLLNVES